MGVISVSIKEYGPWFVSGIPRQVEIDTNVPAVVFYTMDGSDPTTSSSVYLEPINLPTDSGTVRIRALAVSGSDRGSLDVMFYTDSTKIYFPRRSDYVGGMGVVVDAYDVDPVLIDGYGSDDYNNIVVPVRRSDYALQDLEIQYSSTGPDGYGPGTLIRLGIPPEEYWQDDAVNLEPTTPSGNNAFFNPRSLYVIIDGRDGYDDQSVFILNRPFGSTMDLVKYYNGKSFYIPNPYISGGLIKSFYSATNRVRVSYYFDFNENRWIKSIQNFDPETYPKGLGRRNSSSAPCVFKWIYNKRSMI